MVMKRCIYRLTVQTLSELHVGTGATELKAVGREGESEHATIVTDSNTKPWIPGSTLKGAFRANTRVRAEQLFGEAHRNGAAFARGELTFFGFSLVQSTDLTPKVRTAVDAGTGASAARKLFAQDYVAVGTSFFGDVVLECPSDRFVEAKAAFETCLRTFARVEGVAIGSGKADGLGRIRLIKGEASVQELTRTGWTEGKAETARIEPADDQEWTSIEFDCPGPYLVFGSVEGGGPEKPQVTLPERVGTLPRMFPTGVAGALRARAQWLAACAALRRGQMLEDTAISVKTSSGQAERTVVQRLCGAEGYRASMAMKVELLAEAGVSPVETSHPAGPLDPLLQSPLEGALHRRKADCGVRIRLSLRMWREKASQDEHDLFNSLIEDVTTNGLSLGLGTTKGFGWFGMGATTPSTTDQAITSQARALNTTLSQERKAKMPDHAITLPYRQVEVDPDLIGMPEPAVIAAHKARNLHSVPMPDGHCGWVDVSWCFETPMLVGDSKPGSNERNPQVIKGVPVIPGTTLRGAIRNLLETATSARLGSHRMNNYDFPQPRKANDQRTDFPLRRATEEWQKSEKHKQAFDRKFTPDFVQALLGFISPETGDLDPEEHAALHLKSRISFGWAWARSGLDRKASLEPHQLLLASPDPTSVFMDHVGRRIYPATADNAQVVASRIAMPRANPNGNMISKLRFLHPKPNEPLVFRGRIRFHNVTEVELGALLWAVTLGMSPGSRHMIGMARALGAGRCFAADLKMQVSRNDGRDCGRTHSAQAECFGTDGMLAQTFVTAFNAWLTNNGLRTHGFQERLAAADPAYGAALAGEKGFAYQTSQTLKNSLRDGQGNPKRKAIARSNGGGMGGAGRLAAMMKR
jgi:CRISPR/Cas system CSM-associated protein Csm3 (group 7 of RAMP superfamily)